MEEEKYNLVIIGGGPAALTFFYQLLKKSKLPEYLNGLGLCIIEKSKYFGSGNYETKLNYSNSSAIETLKYLVFENQKQEQKSSQSDADFWDQPVKQSYQEGDTSQNQFQDEPTQFLKNLDKNCMALCRELTELHAYQQMIAYGQKQPPKSLLGYFLRLLGNIILRHIKSIKKKLVFKHSQEVIGLRLQTDGWVQIRIHKNTSNIKNAFQTIKAKSVLLCTGRQQSAIPKNISPAITNEDELIKVYQQIGQKPKEKVVILGGGQLGFECGDLLLEGPVTYRQEEEQNTNFAKKRQNCENCCTCKKNNKRCQCDCLCYGSLKQIQYKWNKTDVLIPEFKNGDIVIVSEEKPVVFYENNEGKEKVDKDEIGQQGQINILNGLRGRAKDLLLRIERREEKRIKIINGSSDMDLFRDASVVIESRNVGARLIEIKDMDGNNIKLMSYQQCLLLDQFGRVKNEKGSLKNIYAYGSNSYSNDLIEMSSKKERNRKLGQSSLSYQECCKIEYISRGLKLMDEQIRNREQGVIQSWFDQNEFPRTGQSSQFISKIDFDSDSHSVNSEILDQETVALNSLDEMLKQDKQYIKIQILLNRKNKIRFDQVDQIYHHK